MTGRELVTSSLRLIGAVAPGESLAASEATDGLAALNRMISSWSTESLLIYAKVREEFPLTSGTAAYTMGVGGNFNTSRPQKIEEAKLLVETGPQPIDYPVNVLTLAEWAGIGIKSLQSTIPYSLYEDGGYPLTTITLYPVPSAAHKLVLFSWKPLTEISTLDTAIAFPPGYEEALIYNLAIRLSPEYGRAVSGDVAAIAGDSLAKIKRMNHRPRYLRCDEALTGAGTFNIYRGDSK